MKRNGLKKKNIFLIGVLAVAGLFGVSAAAIDKQVNDTFKVEKANATTDAYTLDVRWGYENREHNCWKSSIQKKSTDWTNLARDTNDNSQVAVKNIVVADGDQFRGHCWYQWYNNESYERKETGFSNNATDSDWDNSGDGNITCHTAGVYSLYYKPDSGGSANGWTFIAWGTITVNLYCYDSIDTSVLLDSSSTTFTPTTESSTYAVPDYPNIDDYVRETNWKTSNDISSGVDYVAVRPTSATLNLYAFYSPDSFSITYKRNNNSATSDVTETKEYGEDYTIATPQSGNLSASGWAPRTYKRFLKWSTNSEGTTGDHAAGSTYTDNAGLTLYYIEEWYKYRYSTDEGNNKTWINLVENNTGKGQGVVVQFAPENPQTLPLHATLYFQYSSDGGSHWNDLSVTTFSGNTNNYDPSTGIKLETLDTIYLKITDSNTYDCWVPGVSERTINITSGAGDSSGEAHTLKGSGRDGSGREQCVTVATVYVERGQWVKGGYNASLYKLWLEDGSTDSFSNQGGSYAASSGILCEKTGVFTMYLKKDGESSWNLVYIGRDDVASAKKLAQKFNTAITPICSDIQGGTKALSDLQSSWGTDNTKGLYYHFTNQPTATMNYFTGATSTSDTDILNAIERYNYILNKYGTSSLPNMWGRGDSYKEAVRNFTIDNIFGSEDSASTIIIIIASSVALLSVTALSILVLKKRRREQE